MTTPDTLRVRFALAQGYQRWKQNDKVVLAKPDDETAAYWKQCGAVITDEPLTETNYYGFTQFKPLPDPTDANDVREALMQMTEEEWYSFADKLWWKLETPKPLCFYQEPTNAFVLALKTPPPTLAEIYCEVKGIPLQFER